MALDNLDDFLDYGKEYQTLKRRVGRQSGNGPILRTFPNKRDFEELPVREQQALILSIKDLDRTVGDKSKRKSRIEKVKQRQSEYYEGLSDEDIAKGKFNPTKIKKFDSKAHLRKQIKNKKNSLPPIWNYDLEGAYETVLPYYPNLRRGDIKALIKIMQLITKNPKGFFEPKGQWYSPGAMIANYLSGILDNVDKYVEQARNEIEDMDFIYANNSNQ